MPALLIYGLKLSVCLGIIYLFYFLVLQNLTFYNWNRWYLLIGTSLCFIIPLINIAPYLQSGEPNNLQVLKGFPAIINISNSVLYSDNSPGFFEEYWYQIIAIVFVSGVIFQAGKLILQFVSFFRLRKSAIKLQHGTLQICQVDKEIAPFSFGSAIYLNQNLHQPNELQEILRHEQVHVEQKHTIDMLWLECICLVNWFNPFAWFLKKSVRQNLEFIADRVVVMTPDHDKKYYQYLILKIIGLPNFTIVNQFNVSSLKTRIIMMNKMPSSKRELAKFLFVFPVMALLLLACQEDLSLTEASNVNALQKVLPPPPPPVPEPAAPDVAGNETESFDLDAFFKRNPTISNITPLFRNNAFKTMKVTLKSGKTEIYNFENDKELALFRQKYGYIPVTNLPPPPPPVVHEASADIKLFMKQHPQIELVGWQGENTMVIFQKSGKREEYDLNNPATKAQAEKIYGLLPLKPPIPPSGSSK